MNSLSYHSVSLACLSAICKVNTHNHTQSLTPIHSQDLVGGRCYPEVLQVEEGVGARAFGPLGGAGQTGAAKVGHGQRRNLITTVSSSITTLQASALFADYVGRSRCDNSAMNC